MMVKELETHYINKGGLIKIKEMNNMISKANNTAKTVKWENTNNKIVVDEKIPKQLEKENIIPLVKYEKRYDKSLTFNGWTDYQKTEFPKKELENWDGNYGVICGDPLGKGRYLGWLDIDDEKFEEGIFQEFMDIETPIIKTPNKGYHLYFYTDKEFSPMNLRDYGFDVDIAASSGRLSVIPPSTVKGENGEIKKYEVYKDAAILHVEDLKKFIFERLGIKEKKSSSGIIKRDNNIKIIDDKFKNFDFDIPMEDEKIDVFVPECCNNLILNTKKGSRNDAITLVARMIYWLNNKIRENNYMKKH